MDKFIWSPDLGAEWDSTPLVKVIKFGDGYESRTSESINSQPTSWSVVFTRPLKVYKEIKAFLTAQGAKKVFQWTDPEGVTANFVCRSWKGKQVGFGVFEIQAKFEEVYE